MHPDYFLIHHDLPLTMDPDPGLCVYGVASHDDSIHFTVTGQLSWLVLVFCLPKSCSAGTNGG